MIRIQYQGIQPHLLYRVILNAVKDLLHYSLFIVHYSFILEPIMNYEF